MYLDAEGRQYEYPTVYVTKPNFCSLSYDPDGRRYIIHTRLRRGRVEATVDIEAQARGIPFWLGKLARGPYVVHGAYPRRKDIDIWGAYWDVGRCRATLKIAGREPIVVQGPFLFDRAVHRVYRSPDTRGLGGAPLAFSCMYITGDDFDLMIAHSDNPSPEDFGVPFQHEGRLNFPQLNESYQFDDFTLIDSGGLQPKEFRIRGRFEAGEVDLVGRPYDYFPPRWHPGRGTWWDPNGRFVWGRAFSRFNGTIILHGKKIEVRDAWSIGEFTRFAAGSR